MKSDETTVSEQLNCQYTLWRLLTEYRTEIPIIQRDYVQGRNSAKAIRQELLESIYNALVTGNCLDFDFVYGSSENCEEKIGRDICKYNKLLPLDGQQRLTTLFLLHWYLAEKETRMENVRDTLSRFSYTNRISSREFCKMLVYLDYTPVSEESVSTYIKNENLYFEAWNSDPTIRAMLTMLDEIHIKFFNCEPLFDKLISDSPELITFSYLPMEHYALTDDLYIKMNARGKALSLFENFKAQFIKHLKKFGLQYEHFEESIDGQWVNLLWDYRSGDNTIDKQFINLFQYFTEMIFLWMEIPQECESPFKMNDIRKLVDYYDSPEKLQLFYDLMDLWECKNEAKEYLEDVLSKNRVANKVRLFDGQLDIFSDVVQGKTVSITNKILLFSVMNRLIMLGKQTNRDMMLDYIRIARNLLIKNRSFSSSKCIYTPDFRFGRNGIPYTSFIANNLAGNQDPYRIIMGGYTEDYEGINSEVFRQEAYKANIIIDKPKLKSLIHSLEDLVIFKGSIFNIIDYAIECGEESLIDDLESLFDAKNSDDIIPALLSVGNYGIRCGTTFLGDRYFYGNKEHWYEVLTYHQGGEVYKNSLIEFIKQYRKNKLENVSDTLREIAASNLRKIGSSDWRYCLIKYPSVVKNTVQINSPNIVFAFYQGKGTTVLHRMNGKTLNAVHVIPELIEASLQLKGECSEYIAGQNSDNSGSVRLTKIANGQIRIGVNGDGRISIQGYDDSNEFLVDSTLEKFNESDISQLDRVEKVVLMAKLMIDTFTASSDQMMLTPSVTKV